MQVQSLGQEDPVEEGNPLQCSCLENPMERGTWWATIHGVTKGLTQLKRFSMYAGTHIHTPWNVKESKTLYFVRKCSPIQNPKTPQM